MMINKALSLLNYDNFLILTHKRPDGDTTGSASALCQVLRAIGKTAYILPNEEITPKFEFLIKPYFAPDDYKHNYIITTDVASVELLPESAKKYADCIDFCIDHHFLSNKGYAKENLIIDTAACGEIICDIAKLFKIEINKDIAMAIYVAISTDTGCFKYSNTSVNTHMIAGECLKHINAGEINRVLFDMKTKQRVEIESRVLKNMEFLYNDTVAIIEVTLKDRAETGATADDLDSISALPRSIEGVTIAVTLNELENGGVKVSLRTSGEASASDICSVYGGGGHLRAAGVTLLDTTLSQAKSKIIEAIKQVCNYV